MTRAQMADRRAAWMAQAQATAVELKPALAGRLDWQTAEYLYRQRFSAKDAGRRLAGLPDHPRHACQMPGHVTGTCPACQAVR